MTQRQWFWTYTAAGLLAGLLIAGLLSLPGARVALCLTWLEGARFPGCPGPPGS